MPIDITLAIRDESGSYYINAYIVLVSVFENTKSPVRVHILHDDSIHYGKADLEELCAKYGQEILFHRVPDFDPEVAASITRWFNLGTMYRYYMQDFIPSEKVIYLDCDIIVNRDIKDLWEVPLNGALVGAVKDFSSYWTKSGQVRSKYREKIAYLKITPDTCYDAGVMVVNLERLRELDRNLGPGRNLLMERTIAALDLDINLECPDQDILNAVCAELPNGLLLLDESFNYMLTKAGRLYDGLDVMQGKIVQFIKGKTDEYFFPAQLVYWKYYAKSKFSTDMFERMDAVFRNKRMRIFEFYAKNPKHRQHATDLLESGFGGLLMKSLGRSGKKK